MDSNEFFLGPRYKSIRKVNTEKLNDNNCRTMKCEAEEINKLLTKKKCMFKQPHYERCASLSECEWDNNLKLAKVTKVGKNLTKNFSHSWNKSMYLYPEECLCLLEMKCLLLKWNGKKMSIKNAYALLLSVDSGCTFEQFRTYSYLVKLGFRVFRYNNELKNNDDFDSFDNLTKLPERSGKKYKYKQTNCGEFNNIHSSKDKLFFAELESTSLVTISRPPLNYLPFNLQPEYDTYSFNLTVSSDNLKISEVTFFNKTLNLEKNLFDSKVKPMICDSPKSTEIYPLYEKTTPKIIESDKNIFEPQVKRLKTEKDTFELPKCIASIKHINNSDDTITFAMDNLLTISNGITCTSSGENTINKVRDVLNNEKKMETKEDSNKIHLTNRTFDNLKTENNNQINNDGIVTDLNLNVNSSSKDNNNSNAKLHNKSKASNDILKDEMSFDLKLNLPSHISQKLFAIKPTNVHNQESREDVSNVHRVQFDVYYPDNNVPKTLRGVPDFRVIVFEDDLVTFPNLYNVNASNPHDNVPTLWAIVNSSSVSFYNVNNIILPKPTDWKIQNNKRFQKN